MAEGLLWSTCRLLALCVLCGFWTRVFAASITISTYTELYNLPVVKSGDRLTFAPGPFRCNREDFTHDCQGRFDYTDHMQDLLLQNVDDVVVDATGAVFDCNCRDDVGILGLYGSLSNVNFDSRSFLAVINSTRVVIRGFDFASIGAALLVQFSEVTVENLFLAQTIDYGVNTRVQGLRIRDHIAYTILCPISNQWCYTDYPFTPSRVVLNNVWLNHTCGLYFGGAVQVHGMIAASGARTSLTWNGGGAYDATVINTQMGKGAAGTLVGAFVFAYNATLSFTDVWFAHAAYSIGVGGQCTAGGIAIFNTDAMLTRVTVRDSNLCMGSPTSFGGGIFISAASSLVLRDSILQGNTADNGGGLYVTADNVCPDRGDRSSPYDTSSTRPEGNSRLCASAVAGDSSTASRVTISGTTFIDNSGRSRAGGIYFKTPGSIVFEGPGTTSFIRQLHATASASAFYCTDSTPRGTVTSAVNTSLYLEGNTLGTANSIADCSFCGCCIFNGPHATFPENAPFTGAVVHPACGYGFQAAASGVTCNNGAQSPQSATVCSAIPCPTLTSPPNGRVSPLIGYFGSASTYTCRPGFSIDGPQTIHCLEGFWDGNATCVGALCPALQGPAPSSVVFTTTTGETTTAPRVGDSAQLLCDAGFALGGSQGWDCAPDAAGAAVWVPQSSTNSTCEALTCQTGAGVEYSSTCGDSASYQQTCTFTCQPGYAGVSLVDTTCSQEATNAAGQFASLPTCAPCVKDSFSNAGDESCTACGNGYTLLATSAGPESCLCLPGFYDALDQGKCTKCPTGATCNGGKELPTASAGYIQSSGAFIQCVPKASCDGANLCAAGYSGRLCGECAPGFYRIGGHCSTCTRNTSANLIVAIVVLTILGLLLAWAAAPNSWGGKESAISAIFSLLFFAQIVSVFQDVRFEWSESVLNLFAILSSVNYNIDLLNLECLFADFNFYSRLFFYLSLPLVMIGVYAMLLMVLMLVSIARRHVSCKDALRDNAVFVAGGFLLFCQTFYLAVTRYTFAFFACFEQGDGSYILSLAPSLQCYTAEWYQALAFPIFGLVFYVAGIPIASWCILKHYQRKGSVAIAVSHPLTHNYAARYTVAHRGWELTVLLRKFAIAIFLAIFAEQPVLQAVLCGAVLFLACVASTVWRPLVVSRDNHLESVSLVGTFAVLFAGLISVPDTVTTDSREIIGVIIIVIVSLELILLAYFVARDLFITMNHYQTLMHAYMITSASKINHAATAVLHLGGAGVVVVAAETIAVLKNGEVDTTIEAPGTVSAACAIQPASIAAVADGELRIFNVESGKELTSEAVEGEVVALSASAEVLAAATNDGSTLKTWRLARGSNESSDGKVISGAQTADLPDGMSASALLTAGYHVWVGSRDGGLLRYDVLNDVASDVWAAHNGVPITCLASHDNLVLAGGTDGVIAVFDTTLNRVVHSLIGHHGAVASLAIVPGMLLSGAHDGTVRLWSQGQNGRLLATLPVAHSAFVAVHADTTGQAPHEPKVATAWGETGSDTENGGGDDQLMSAESVVATAAGSKGIAYTIRIHPASFALREKQLKRVWCVRLMDASAVSAITGRMNNDEAEAEFWDLDRKHLRESLSGHVSLPLMARLSTEQQRRLHRFAHVAGRVKLAHSSSSSNDDNNNDSKGKTKTDKSKGHSSSDGTALKSTSKSLSSSRSKSKSGASVSSVTPLSE